MPDGFTFALKLAREITHERRLLACERLVEEFVASALEFGAKLEAILIQLPPDFDPSQMETIEAFVAALPRGPRWALEVRDPAWLHGDAHSRLRDVLGTHGVALAAIDGPFVPLDAMVDALLRPTASHAYVRWLGKRGSLPRFDAIVVDRSDRIARWAEAIRAAAPQLTRVCGYASNEFAGHAPATIRDLWAALGIPHERPPRIEQTSLFG